MTNVATVDQSGSPDRSVTDPDPKRWLALAIVAVAQLMVILDASIVTIALPSVQRSLHISVANRQWMVTAYTLAFGGLLLLGGRIGDYLGRKRMFIIGLFGFALASALGGAATNTAMLFGARALQGAFAAIMAPAALSLLSVTFTEVKERATAFGVFAGVSGAGGAIGVVLGGVLTQYASWRWCLFVNVPIASIAALAAMPVIGESKAPRGDGYDIPGTVTVTAGLVALVYGFTKAASDGWLSGTTLSLLGVAVALLALFVGVELRSQNPLLPMRIILERNRGGSLLTSFLVSAGLLGMFLFLTYFFQGVLGYSPLKAGLALLPFSIGIMVAAGASSNLVPKVGPRLLMAIGFGGATVGMLWLTRVTPTTSFAAHVLPGEILISLGMGLGFPPMQSTSLFRIPPKDAGVASGLVNATQQVGQSLGVALLNTVAASATATYLLSRAPTRTNIAAAQTHGYAVGFFVASLFLAGAVVSAVLLVNASRADLADINGTSGEVVLM